MKKNLSSLFSVLSLLIFISCGDGAGEDSIVWHDESKGIKAWERVTQNGVTTVSMYHTNGQKKCIEEYKGNVKHGTCTRWYENGKIEAETKYENGIKVGNHKRFYDNGQLSLEKFFNDDSKTEKWALYFPNGQVWKTDN